MEKTSSITRCAGISTGTFALCGDGYIGCSDELDKAVQREAEFLREKFRMDVEIRFNHNRESGGAFLVDGCMNCSIGLGTRQLTERTYKALMRNAELENDAEFKKLFSDYAEYYKNRIGEIEYSVLIDTSVANTDIEGKKEFRRWDFDTFEKATAFLDEHCFGYKDIHGILGKPHTAEEKNHGSI